MPSDWGAIPKADFKTVGIIGWYLCPEPVGAFACRIPPEELCAEIPEPDKTLVDFTRRPSKHQELYEMTPEEQEGFWNDIELTLSPDVKPVKPEAKEEDEQLLLPPPDVEVEPPVDNEENPLSLVEEEEPKPKQKPLEEKPKPKKKPRIM